MHYLHAELLNLVHTDSAIFDWIDQGSLDGLWYWDLEEGNSGWMSPKFCTTFGYEYGELENTADWWQANIHPEDLPLAVQSFEKHKEDPDFNYDQVARYKHKQGHWVWVRCRGLIIRNGEGVPTRMLGAHTDVTGLMETQYALGQAESSLVQRNRELERTTYILSHDLRKPTRHMVGFAQAFLEDAEDLGLKCTPEMLGYLKSLRSASERIEGLLDGILTFARSGEVGTLEKLDLKHAWSNAIQDNLTDEQIQAATFRIEDPLDAATWGSPIMVYQLLGNLIANSIKFAHPSRRPLLTLRVTEGTYRTVVQVQDNGRGIPEGMHENAFDLFRRVGDQSLKVPGMGLGLAVCQRIVEAHGGKILAFHAPGGGTIVQFDLPKSAPSENATQLTSAPG